MSSDKNNRYHAPALDKGLDILEYLSEEAVPRSQAEIAEGIGRGPNEIYRMLVGLEARGYLLRSEQSGKYRLSLKLYQLSHTHSPMEQLLRAARLPMEELANTLRQSCHLSVIHKNQLMVIGQTPSPDPVSLSVAEGTLFPLVNTISGRVLLAFEEADQLEEFLAHDTDYQTMKSAEQKRLHTHLAKIKKQGYDLSLSGFTEGVTECATIVGDAQTGVTAALCVAALTTGLRQRLPKVKLTNALLAAAKQIDQRIGL